MIPGQIFLESKVKNSIYSNKILSAWPSVEVVEIDDYFPWFNQVRKPYLQKRKDWSFFIAQKKGVLVKEAPEAYGLPGAPHFYYVHTYNCPYECHYCYLQGHFSSPDLVFFVNHEEIIEAMRETLQTYTHPQIWFHGGEFSDSLVYSHRTGELPLYHHFFSQQPRAQWELRTKSLQIRPLLELEPLTNLTVSYSLSPEALSSAVDEKTPPLSSRLKAMQKLANHGHHLGVHLDPVFYHPQFAFLYNELIEQMRPLIGSIRYWSLGTIRFPGSTQRQVQKNYPESLIHQQPFATSPQGGAFYPRPLRFWMLNTLKETLLRHGVSNTSLYFSTL